MYKSPAHPQLPNSAIIPHQPTNPYLILTSHHQTIHYQHILYSFFSFQKMLFPQALMALGALLAFSPPTDAFALPCVYQGYKCGYTMVSKYSVSTLSFPQTTRPVSSHLPWTSTNVFPIKAYNNTELTSAVNKTMVVPPLSTIQLLNVLYRCVDTAGDIAANAFCIAGCESIGGVTDNDMCAM